MATNACNLVAKMFKGSLPAIITPFDADGAKVDYAALEAFLEWQLAEGTNGFVPVGTTGESPTLSHAEHEAVVSAVVRQVAGRVPVIAGAGSNNTEEAIRFTRHAAEVGADAALVIVPYYNKPNQEFMYRHFKAVHDSADIPIVLYNVPGRTVADLQVETVARLAELPRIVGIKDASVDLSRPPLTRLKTGPEFCQLSGEDCTALGFNAFGGVGCISVTANVAPKLCAQMQKASLEGDYKLAGELNDKLAPLHRALFLEPSPAPAKYALSLLGKCQNVLRSPLFPASEAGEAAVRAAMVHAGLID